ncbi:MAG: hypothetical protein ABGY96_14900 [bacterium]|nr:hypothetical protein [Gammaproteobacteria bacterium]HIL96446.1 hypothetical protein [Pseudomonadales bacterium]
MEQSAVSAANLNFDADASTSADNALQKYQSFDDLAGQWRIHDLKTRMALRQGDRAEAEVQVSELETLSVQLSSRHIFYQTHLLSGQVNEDPQHFADALRFASTSLEQAVVHTYLGTTDKAIELIQDDLKNNVTNNPADRAFIYYRAGLSSGSSIHYQLALQYYQLAEDARGVADTLVRLARQNAENNRLQEAKVFAYRAIKALRAIGDTDRANSVNAWQLSL